MRTKHQIAQDASDSLGANLDDLKLEWDNAKQARED